MSICSETEQRHQLKDTQAQAIIGDFMALIDPDGGGIKNKNLSDIMKEAI